MGGYANAEPTRLPAFELGGIWTRGRDRRRRQRRPRHRRRRRDHRDRPAEHLRPLVRLPRERGSPAPREALRRRRGAVSGRRWTSAAGRWRASSRRTMRRCPATALEFRRRAASCRREMTALAVLDRRSPSHAMSMSMRAFRVARGEHGRNAIAYPSTIACAAATVSASDREPSRSDAVERRTARGRDPRLRSGTRSASGARCLGRNVALIDTVAFPPRTPREPSHLDRGTARPACRRSLLVGKRAHHCAPLSSSPWATSPAEWFERHFSPGWPAPAPAARSRGRACRGRRARAAALR